MNNTALKQDEFPFDIIDVEQGTEAWLAFRKLGIGCSDWATIMGKNPYKSAYELWLQLTGRTPEVKSNYMMERGTRLEPRARACAEEHFNVRLSTPVLASKEYPWMIASLDGANDDFTFILEIKSPHINTYNAVLKSQEVPEMTYYQTQGHMAVSGAERVNVQYFSGEDSVYLVSLRNEELIQKCIEAIKEFRSYVVNDIAPPITDEQPLFIAPEDTADLKEEALFIKSSLDGFKKKWDEMRRRILDRTDGGPCVGDFFKVSYGKPKETVNYKKLVSDLNISEDVLSKYTKTGIGYPTVTVK